MRRVNTNTASLVTASAARMDRRRLLRLGFWGVLAAAGAVALGQAVEFLKPQIPQKPGPFKAGNVKDFPPGIEPQRFPDRSVWLVHVTPDKGGEGKYSGLIALDHHCTHMGCPVPWRADFQFEGKTGWFRCPCHGATFTYSGGRVFGPAQRNMDTLKLTVDKKGNITVDDRFLTPGGTSLEESASRATSV